MCAVDRSLKGAMPLQKFFTFHEDGGEAEKSGVFGAFIASARGEGFTRTTF